MIGHSIDLCNCALDDGFALLGGGRGGRGGGGCGG